MDSILNQCACCGARTFGTIEKDAGDLIIPCSNCGAKNIMGAKLLSDAMSLLPAYEIIGWRE